jgi:antitoxin ParD1/3/4/toxin ParE1/3/4
MSRRAYELSAAARLDLLQIWNYLAEASSLNVADKVVADIEASIRKIAKTPGLGHRRPDLTDRDILFYRVHSYLILYRPDKKPLNVVRIVHGSRDVKSLLAE